MRIGGSLLLVLSAVLIVLGVWLSNQILFWLGLVILILLVVLLIFLVLVTGTVTGLLSLMKKRLEKGEVEIKIKRRE